VSEAGVPETWQGTKLEPNMTADDLLPSRQAAETMVKNLKR